MFTLTIFTLAAALVCFFGGGFWLAAAVTGIVVAKLFPVAAIFFVVAVIGLAALRFWRS